MFDVDWLRKLACDWKLEDNHKQHEGLWLGGDIVLTQAADEIESLRSALSSLEREKAEAEKSLRDNAKTYYTNDWYRRSHEAEAKVAALERELETAHRVELDEIKRREAAEARAARYREALEFYARRRNYEFNDKDINTPVFHDNGETARAALGRGHAALSDPHDSEEAKNAP